MGKRRGSILNNSVIALESLNHEVSSMAQHSINEGREYLNDLEIQHLIKMTNNVVMKIKMQILEIQL
jgi:hypothetical protein